MCKDFVYLLYRRLISPSVQGKKTPQVIKTKIEMFILLNRMETCLKAGLKGN